MTKDVRTVGEDLPLIDAYQLFHDYEIRHLPVVHDGKLTGIISVRDIGKLVLKKLGQPGMGGERHRMEMGLVRDVMTRDLVTVGPDEDLEKAALIMYNEKISALPVVERSRNLVGIVTTHDLLEVLVCELEWTKRRTPRT
jgi:acetoin utilization protein AcuB